jgi:hypothetical protein
MNKKHGLLFGFAALFLAAMFSFTACSSGGDDDDGGGGGTSLPAAKGKIKVSGLDSYNGKYIWGSGMAGGNLLYGITDFTGDSSELTFKLVKITGGTAEIPLYRLNQNTTSASDILIAYDGNDAATGVTLSILDDADGLLKMSEFGTVTSSAVGKMILDGTFSNGNLTVDWSGF